MKTNTRRLVEMGVFAALICVLSVVPIPVLFGGVPITLQTFIIALSGVVLGWKNGCVATLVYIILGCVGVPVFSGMNGGVQVLFGPTGGFIIGFIPMSALCGVKINKYVNVICGMSGLIMCHLCGIMLYMRYAGITFYEAFITVSLPFVLKDVLCVAAAYAVGQILKKRIGNR